LLKHSFHSRVLKTAAVTPTPVHVETTVHRHCHQTAGCAAHSQSSQLWRTISPTKYWLPVETRARCSWSALVSSTAVTCSWHYSEKNSMQNIEMYRSQNLKKCLMHLLIRLTHEDDQTTGFTNSEYSRAALLLIHKILVIPIKIMHNKKQPLSP